MSLLLYLYNILIYIQDNGADRLAVRIPNITPLRLVSSHFSVHIDLSVAIYVTALLLLFYLLLFLSLVRFHVISNLCLQRFPLPVYIYLSDIYPAVHHIMFFECFL